MKTSSSVLVGLVCLVVVPVAHGFRATSSSAAAGRRALLASSKEGIPTLNEMIDGQVEGELNLPAYRKRGDRYIPQKKLVTINYGGFREQRKGSLVVPPVAEEEPVAENEQPIAEVATAEATTTNESLYEQRNARVVAAAAAGKSRWGSLEVDRAEFLTDESKPETEEEEEPVSATEEETAIIDMEEELETEQVPLPMHPMGITEDDVTDKDADAVEHVTKRIMRIHPNMHPDLVGLVFWVQNGALEEATEATRKLLTILDEEKAGEETTQALYRACGQQDIVRMMMSYGDDEDLQQLAMQVVWKLTSQKRASEIGFEEISELQKSLAAVGAADCAFAAIKAYPENVSLAAYSLSVINNVIDTYTFDELFDLGVIPETMAAMKKFPDDTSVQFVACDILYRASMSKPGAKLAKLESVQAVSALAQLLERYSGVDDRLHHKAEQALQAVLLIGKTSKMSDLVL